MYDLCNWTMYKCIKCVPENNALLFLTISKLVLDLYDFILLL